MDKKANKILSIFSEGYCLTAEQLVDYSTNKLSSENRLIVERHLIHCELCSDALDGVVKLSSPEVLNTYTEKINAQIGSLPESRKLNRMIIPISRRWLSVAALVIVVVGAGLFTYFNLLKNNSEKIFAENYDKYPDKVSKKQNLKLSPPEEIIIPEIPGPQEPISSAEEGNRTGSTETEIALPTVKKIAAPPAPEPIAQADMEEVELDDANELSQISEDAPTVIISKEMEAEYTATPNSKSIHINDTPVESEQLASTKSQRASKQIGDSPGKKQRETKTNGYKDEAPKALTKPITKTDSITTGSIEFQIDEIKQIPSGTNTYNWDMQFNIEETMLEAMELYERNKYADAVSLFNNVLGYDPLNDDALFYKALSLIEINRVSEAIPLFDLVLSGNKPEYHEAAQWYKSLALIKEYRKSEARKILQEIVSGNGAYSSKARKVLDDLK